MLRSLPESYGAERVSSKDRIGSLHCQTWLWATTNLNPFVIAYGFIVMESGLSWPGAMWAILVGGVVGYSLLGFVAVAGPRGGRPTMALSRLVFGRVGNCLPGTATYLALLGWSAVNLVLAVLAAGSLFRRVHTGVQEHVRLICFMVAALIVIVLAFFGYRLVMAVQPWIGIFSTATVLVYVAFTADLIRLPTQETYAKSPAAYAGGAVFVLAAGGLAWVMVGTDYSRYLPESSKSVGVWAWTALGGGLPAVVLMLYGVLLCASHPQLAAGAAADPVGALAGLAPSWLGPVFLGVTVVGFTSNAAINLYSSGLAILALGVSLKRSVAVLASGMLMLVAAGYLVFVSPGLSATFESFLAVLGVPIAAWCAVFLTESRRMGKWLGAVSHTRAFSNTVAVVLASFVGFGLITSRDPALQALFGYLLTEHATELGWGRANVGVPAAFVFGWAFSRVLLLR